MKLIQKSIFYLCLACVSSCSAEVTSDITPLPDITINSFPVIDGSDSTDPLRDLLMCKILGFEYKWERRPFTQDPQADIKEIIPEYTCSEADWRYLETTCLKHSNTHQSFINLIDDKVELVIAARSISRDEKAYAEETGVTLIEKPIAKDALTFMVNPSNPVSNLSISQLQQIYTGEITNWKEVGGNDEEIRPYVRNRNSGSQEKFETLVMEGLKIAEFPELQVGLTMMSPYYQLEEDKQGIGFSPFYYYSVIVDNGSTKAIGLDGVPMTKDNVQNNTYPYTTYVYAAVRSDIDRNSTAYELFEFLTTPAGQDIVNESGYVPLNQNSAIGGIHDDSEIIVSTKYTDLKGVLHKKPRKGIMLKTDVYKNGKSKISKILVE
ncbi:MAG: phosphate ABC transporter substrate-binding protein [Bacteroides sp.]|nr:phosphate ABC transporter substrate-binding protein [Bacteroides sp.]